MTFCIETYLWSLFHHYNIYVDDIIVFGSAALAKFTIIRESEVNDIDTVINHRSWNILLKKCKPQCAKLGGRVIKLGEIELFDFFGFNFGFNSVFSKSININGWKYMHPEDLREWYKLSGREKDLVKIKKIDLYLEEHPDIKITGGLL